MKLACSTIMLGRFDLDTALREIAEAGFSAVELLCAGLPGRPAHLDVAQGQGYARETQERVAKYGLDIASLVCYGSLTDPYHWSQVVKAMGMAGAMGVPAVVDIAPRPQGDRPMQALVDLGKELGRMGASWGVKFGMKPHLGLTVWNTH